MSVVVGFIASDKLELVWFVLQTFRVGEDESLSQSQEEQVTLNSCGLLD